MNLHKIGEMERVQHDKQFLPLLPLLPLPSLGIPVYIFSENLLQDLQGVEDVKPNPLNNAEKDNHCNIFVLLKIAMRNIWCYICTEVFTGLD